jgi:uncharacterized protein (TIGR03032 family)
VAGHRRESTMSEPSTTVEKLSPTVFRLEPSAGFVEVLDRLGACLLVSTYQAGKLLVVGAHKGTLSVSFHDFDKIMGIAASPSRIAVGSRRQIWFLPSVPELAPEVKPAGKHDAFYMARSSHVTGDIHAHEIAWAGDKLWFVNTLFSCLCTLDDRYSFVPRWKPKFITALAGDDRCHLNGLAMEGGLPRYLTAHAATNTASGWRPEKANGGCLIDVPSGEVVARGFAMPHSPRLYDGKLWLLNSGQGRLSTVDPQTGREEPVAQLPGYTRGMAFIGPYAFVGLSKIRERSYFGGLPIEQRLSELRCGIRVVDTRSGQVVASLDFHAGVDEIFAVESLPWARVAAVTGPKPLTNGDEIIWYVPSLPSS